MDNIPLEPGAWDALIRRYLDEVESAPERHAVAQYKCRQREIAVKRRQREMAVIARRQRELAVNALFQQEKATVPRDAAAINKAQAEYDKRLEELTEPLERDYVNLSSDAGAAYDAFHEAENSSYEDGTEVFEFSFALRTTPKLTGDVAAIERGAASDEYKQFAAKCAAAAAELATLRKKLEALRNPSPDNRPPLGACSDRKSL